MFIKLYKFVKQILLTDMTSNLKLNFKAVNMSDGRALGNCDYLPEESAGAPAGFIAVRRWSYPDIVTFVKVANITSFDCAEDDVPLVWRLFETVPETIRVLRGFE